MYLQQVQENLMALMGTGIGVLFTWSMCSPWRWCGSQGSAQLPKGRSGDSLSISRSHRHKFAIVCPELEHRRWNTAELLDLACAALARLFLEGGLVPFSIGKGGYIYFFFPRLVHMLSTHSWGNGICDEEEEALPWKGSCQPAGCCQLLAWVKQTPWVPSFTKHICVIETGNTTALEVTLPVGVCG